jgi:hypothetical protein
MNDNIRNVIASEITRYYGELYAPNVVAEALAYNLIQGLERAGYVIEQACHPDCGPLEGRFDKEHTHYSEDGLCYHDDEEE